MMHRILIRPLRQLLANALREQERCPVDCRKRGTAACHSIPRRVPRAASLRCRSGNGSGREDGEAELAGSKRTRLRARYRKWAWQWQHQAYPTRLGETFAWRLLPKPDAPAGPARAMPHQEQDPADCGSRHPGRESIMRHFRLVPRSIRGALRLTPAAWTSSSTST